ncbi:MAG: OsmC family protein [Chloroflexota bacterium]
MRTVDVTWDQVAERFTGVGKNPAHPITIAAPARPGERRPATGFSPADLLLAGMGSCSLWDVVEILGKSRQTVDDLTVRVSGEQEADPPWTFRKVHLHYTFVGTSIDPAVAERAVRLSVDKYCSVIATVRHAADITDSFEIVAEREAASATAG